MGKKLWMVILIGVLAIECSSSPKVSRFETITYKSASPENKLKIEQGEIGIGMSIEECKAACPECQFIRKFASMRGFELWEVTGEKNLYLHVQDGRIEKVSKYTPHPIPP
jgi:hypothetical protein